MTGLTEEELVGVRLSKLPNGAFQILGYSFEEKESLLETIEGGQVPPSTKITKRVSALKPERMIERLTTQVRGQEDRAIGWVIVLRDVTEEYEINQARELITETLIHDLRSPMSAVLGALDLFDELLPPEQHTNMVDQSLRVANRSANRVLNLVETMLDISRMRSGRLELGLTPIKIGSQVKSLMAEFVVQANEYGIILHNEVPDDLPLVMMDKEKISRVITNLVDNALKFTPEGGQVTLSASQVSKDEIAFRVTDTGPGIPPEYRDKIFERFAQVPGRRGRKRGSGLGLPFCRMAVEAHGGRIWVESPQDEGSVFTFTLPLEGPESVE
jgi:signal transduction histidine kinase